MSSCLCLMQSLSTLKENRFEGLKTEADKINQEVVVEIQVRIEEGLIQNNGNRAGEDRMNEKDSEEGSSRTLDVGDEAKRVQH